MWPFKKCKQHLRWQRAKEELRSQSFGLNNDLYFSIQTDWFRKVLTDCFAMEEPTLVLVLVNKNTDSEGLVARSNSEKRLQKKAERLKIKDLENLKDWRE